MYNWKDVIPTKTHPRFGGNKHLRLILVNQCGYVVDTSLPVSSGGKMQRFTFTPQGAAEIANPDEANGPADVPADHHHQDYYRKHKSAMYCQMYIVPKLKKLHLIK